MGADSREYCLLLRLLSQFFFSAESGRKPSDSSLYSKDRTIRCPLWKRASSGIVLCLSLAGSYLILGRYLMMVSTPLPPPKHLSCLQGSSHTCGTHYRCNTQHAASEAAKKTAVTGRLQEWVPGAPRCLAMPSLLCDQLIARTTSKSSFFLLPSSLLLLERPTIFIRFRFCDHLVRHNRRQAGVFAFALFVESILLWG